MSISNLAMTHITNNQLREEDWSDSETDESSPRQSISYEAMKKLNDMRVSNQLCDAAIHMDDGTVFYVHRAVLGACSDYFRTLFTTTLNEVQSTQTSAVGIKSYAMDIVLNYAYLRDFSSVNESNVFEIMAVSDYFGVMGLNKFCIDFIIKTMSPENCIMLWVMSRYRSMTRLMEMSKSFILKNFTQVATESKSFLKLKVDDVLSIISDELLNAKDESVVWEAVLRWIDHKPDERVKDLTKLMHNVRLGLLMNSYFMEKVKKNRYVENDPGTKPIILETMRFLCDLDTISSGTSVITTPKFAIPRLPYEVIFAIGGWSEGAPQTIIESYDTRADRWINVSEVDPAGPRSYHGTGVIGTKLYCIGGFNGTEYFNTCSRFDAARKKWREIAPMHTRRCYVSVAVLDGKIYALGGYDGSTRQNTCERYCPKTNQWTMIPSMHFQRSDAHACIMNGKIYITGGFNGQECLNTVEYYTSQTNSWTLLPPMTSRRSGVACVAHRGFLYVIGGFNGLSRMNTGERYDPEHRAWTSIKEMHNPRSNFGLEIIDDMILAIGGFNGVVTISHCECYVPENNEWLEATDMSVIRSALTANVVHGLPNIRDYTHKERDKLVEERRVATIWNNRQRNHQHSIMHSSDLLLLPIELNFDDTDDDDDNNEVD